MAHVLCTKVAVAKLDVKLAYLVYMVDVRTLECSFMFSLFSLDKNTSIEAVALNASRREHGGGRRGKGARQGCHRFIDFGILAETRPFRPMKVAAPRTPRHGCAARTPKVYRLGVALCEGCTPPFRHTPANQRENSSDKCMQYGGANGA